jgi:hypothetical protein
MDLMDNLKGLVYQNMTPKAPSSKPSIPAPSPAVQNKIDKNAMLSSVSKYDISKHSYPLDIMSEQYGGNYVMFYINVSVDSKLLNDKTVKTVEDYDPRTRSRILALNEKLYNTDEKGNATTGSKVGFASLNATGAALEGALAGGLLTGKAKGAVAGAALNAAPAGVAIGVAATQSSTLTRAQKRLKTAIALYVPNQLSVRYGVNWGEEDTFAYQAAASGAEAIIKAVQDGDTKNLSGQAAAIVGAMGLRSDNQGAAASASLGLAPNPKKEQLFKNVDYRTFQFEYQFFPRDEKEAEAVLNIIKEFKYHMHPEYKDPGEFLYVYPSEFDVSYFQNGKINENLHRHTSCVLTEMVVNYTPNGQFNTFANGMPTQINIQMTFKELALLTKDMVKEGL